MVYRDILKSYNTLSNHAYKRTPYHPWYKQTVSYKSEVIKNTKKSLTSFGQLQQDITKENGKHSFVRNFLQSPILKSDIQHNQTKWLDKRFEKHKS